VPSPGNDASPLFTEADSSTLSLVGLVVLAIVLMVSDHRGHFLDAIRREAAVLAGPLYWVASAPARGARAAQEALEDRSQLHAENQRLREELLLTQARLARLGAVAEQNGRLRELLEARNRLGLRAQLGELIDVDLEPFRHRILIDLGADDGIGVGQAVMDASGVLGQIVDVQRQRAELILVTDPGHAVPVRVARTGLRTIAYGTGDTDSLRLPHIPFSAGVRVGDELLTSGVGGVFPAGLPVGVIRQVEPDDSATFVLALATPAASMLRSGEVLVLHDERMRIGEPGAAGFEFVGPPAPLSVAPLDPLPTGAPERGAIPGQ
jgi:rod shape-determining protein MreC